MLGFWHKGSEPCPSTLSAGCAHQTRQEYRIKPENLNFCFVQKILSPIAPLDAFRLKDGVLNDYYLSTTTRSLNDRIDAQGNPIIGKKIDLIFENGETERLIPPSAMGINVGQPLLGEIYQSCAKEAAYYHQLYPSDVNLTNKFYLSNFQSQGVANRLDAYWQPAKHNPDLQNTWFTYYGSDGEPEVRATEWDIMRTVMPTIRKQKYSTPDLYPPLNSWRTHRAYFNAIDWILDARYEELEAQQFAPVGTDKLFSPFVSPGWCPDENYNKRPAQWLGLLKTVNMLGAEFFYTFVANDSRDAMANVPPNLALALDPYGYSATSPNNISIGQYQTANYIWQTAMPSYAQAIGTRYQDVLLNGELMQGDRPLMTTGGGSVAYNYNFTTQITPITDAQNNALNTDYFVVARQLGKKYAIAATLQPHEGNDAANSQIYNDTQHWNSSQYCRPNQIGKLKIKLDANTQLTFWGRRQGSTYIYNSTDPNNIVFYQLDGWHQWEHPLQWNKNFLLEEELYDQGINPSVVKLRTENATTNQPITNGDYTNYLTYITGKIGKQVYHQLTHYFEPREDNKQYNIYVKARSIPNSTYQLLEMNITGDNQIHKDQVPVVCADWHWYKFENVFYAHAAQYAMNHGLGQIQIDKWYITEEPTLPANIQDGTPICNWLKYPRTIKNQENTPK
jgi:hypothetical protein